MKSVRLHILTLGITILCSSLLFGADSRAERPVPEDIKKTIEGMEYTVTVDQMNPSGGASRSLSSGYKITLRYDSIRSVLPYAGVARNIPYGGGDGLVFEEVISNYKVEFDRKGVVQISFRCSHQGEHYSYRLSIFDNRSTIINVTPTNRQFISYRGLLEH